jgi:phosphatidylinositol-3-phosphatase
MRRTAAVLLAAWMGLAGCSRATAPVASEPTSGRPSAGGIPALRHVWLVVLQNHSYEQIVGNPEAPFLNDLANRFALATRYFAVSDESLPNHLAMLAGSTFGCRSSDCGGGLDSPTVASQLDASGRRWAGYFENLPYAGYVGGTVEGYVQHHDPFVYFTSLATSRTVQDHILPLADLTASLADPPAFSLVEPDAQHNMHDGTIAEGDAWIRETIGAIVGSPGYRAGGAIFVVWDQGAFSDHRGCCVDGVMGGRVALIVVSPLVRPGARDDTPSTHYSLLATIEDALGLTRLGLAADPRVGPVAGVWS